MNDSHSKKKKSNDKEKVQNARKQVIKCEAIIRKVLAIQECFMELNTFSENSNVQDNSVQVHENQNQRISTDNLHNDPVINTVHIPKISIPSNSFKSVDEHISTPLLTRSGISDNPSSEVTLKPATQHISTPIPRSKIKRSFSLKRSSSVPDHEEYSSFDEFTEASFHTPPRKHARENYDCYGNRVPEISVVDDDQDKHIKWVDKTTHKPLIQNTPPPSKPLHRETLPLKPCMDSPDQLRKQQLEAQRFTMLTKQREYYLQQLKRQTHIL